VLDDSLIRSLLLFILLSCRYSHSGLDCEQLLSYVDSYIDNQDLETLATDFIGQNPNFITMSSQY